VNAVAQVLAVLDGILLIGVGIVEAFFYRHRRVAPVFAIRPEDHRTVRPWAVNQGFYNMVFGAGMIFGVILVNTDAVTAGRTLVFFVAACHVLLGMVLLATDRRLWRGAAVQSGLAALVLIAALLL
jgi:putative membrane protein